MNRLLTLIACALAAIYFSAQEPADSTTIADHINASGRATVVHPAKLNARLIPKAASAAPENTGDDKPASAAVGGYRIQLYSGNNARTAKNNASGRANRVNDQFPEYVTYITFDAPYWRLRVGDFRSYEDASAALARIKAAMPEYAREMRIVRDKIVVR